MQLKNKSFCVVTLGCRVNQYESNDIACQLINRQAIKIDKISKAEICVFNTCCVTHKAETKCKNLINRAIKSTTCKLIIIVGCYSQLIKSFNSKKIRIVLGTKYKNILGEALDKLQDQEKVIQIDNHKKNELFEWYENNKFIDNTRAFLKIQDGCNMMCTYCLIPIVRGRQRSLNHEIIIQTIKELVSDNYKEIILTGVNTAGYRQNEQYGFYELLKDIDHIPGNFRIRISSVEPFQISKEIIDLITNNKKRWCQHFHICLQSGSDNVLKDMNRCYKIQNFLSICRYIRQKNKNASITTDYIVGFPTETENTFNESMDNLKKIKFSDMHVFPYSKRPFTPASKIKENTNVQQKKYWLDQITKIKNMNKKKYLQTFINKEVNVLFEHNKEKNVQIGHSEYSFIVKVNTKKSLWNELRKVKIIKMTNNDLFGVLL